MAVANATAQRLDDPASAGNVNVWHAEHYALNLALHFEQRRAFGHVDIRIRRLPFVSAVEAGAALVLDSHTLEVASVTLAGAACAFEVKPFAAFGSALHIDLGAAGSAISAGDALTVRVHYATAESSPALSWLAPEQTADKKHPFLFSQGQAVLNRSLFPCQDTPGRRASWEAVMLVPKPYVIVMSGQQEISEAEAAPVSAPLLPTSPEVLALYPPHLGITSATLAESDAPAAGAHGAAFPHLPAPAYRAFRARMPDTVPMYLFALAAGDLRCKRIGGRTRVWSEESLIDRCVWEFGHRDVTENYLSVAEKLFGEYRWGSYSVVTMPTAFPFGGMENPLATFTTPALLTGDQSLTDVIAHEIMHSWAGNMVTNATWSVFWINEGFTMYLQRRVCGEVDGAAVTALETAAGRELLRATVRDYGASHPLTRLVVPIAGGTDPDETYTDVPYEKGFAFVSYLRACAGSDAVFDAWLSRYFSGHAFSAVDVPDIFDSFFAAFPHLRGDWTRERWAAEEAAEAAGWWERPQETPADLESCGQASLPALPAADAATGAVPIADASGRRGLAYRPGYEFMRWMHAPGWPVFYPSCAAGEALAGPAEALAAAWVAAAKAAPAGTPDAALRPADETGGSGKPFGGWPTLQKLHCLDALLKACEADMSVCPPATAAADAPAAVAALRVAAPAWHRLLPALEAAYGFGASTNAEVRLRWSQLVALSVFQPYYPAITAFLTSIGKLKYVVPVMRALTGAGPDPAAADAGKLETLGAAGRPGWQLAASLYRRIQPTLHPAVQSRVEGVLKGHAEALGEWRSAGGCPRC